MKELIKKIQYSKKPLRVLKSFNDMEIAYLNDLFYWTKSQQELIFCVKNNILSSPICDLSYCSNEIKFSEANRKYNIGCCKSHSQMIGSRIKHGDETIRMSSESTEKRKQTFVSRYGVDNPMKVDSMKNKQKESLYNNYGVTTPILNEEIYSKIKQTNIDRYGFDNPMKNKNVRDKLAETNMDLFGFDNCLLNEEIQSKKQDTCFKRYGVRFPLQSSEFLDKVKASKVIKYGVEYPFQSPEIQSKIARLNSLGSSKKEKELASFISLKKETSNRTILKGKELDIYVSDKRIAIEFNGVYWHSELCGKDTNYHLNKTKLCEKKGIQLLHVFENEWDYKKKIIKSIINAKLGLFNKRIYARKCEIKEISPKEKNQFLEENHLQGQDKSSIKIGLFYEDVLVSVMTFGKSRYNKKYSYEMHRFCNKLNYQIIGGASKLWTYFIRNHSPDSVITYADRRYSDGTFYEKIGFKKIRESKPNYFYFKNGNINLMSRIQFQKHKLSDKLELFESSLTEWENMQLNGYNRIWDCGNYVFEWRNKQNIV